MATRDDRVIDGSNLGYLWRKIKAAFWGKNETTEVSIDSTPTANSTNVVTSGGVKAALDNKQDTLVSGSNIKTINNETLLGSGNIETIKPTLEVTYNELVNLKANSQLDTDRNYRITDFVTTTNGTSAGCTLAQVNEQTPYDGQSRSAGHQFDIIVTAASSNELYAECRACLHSGDTYFEDSVITEWRIWYQLENTSSDHCSWGDSNGKGVIYRMIDEFKNDLPYDFKNIQFYRDASLEKYANATAATLTSTEAGYDWNFISDWYYTFSRCSDANGIQDSTITKKSCTDNSFKEYNAKLLNNISLSRNFWENTYGTQTYNNTWYGLNFNNSNICLGGLFYDNVIGDSFYSNVIDSYFYNNLIKDHFNQNNVASNFRDNNLGNNFRRNNIGQLFYSNTIDDLFDSNTTNSGFYNNTIGHDFKYNFCSSIFHHNTIADNFYRNNIGVGFNKNTVGSNVTNNFTYGQCNNNTLCDYFMRNIINPICSYITFGNIGSSSNMVGGLNITGIRGTSSSLVDFSTLPITYGNSASGIYRKINIYGDESGRIIAVWKNGDNDEGYYKNSASDTTWKPLPIDTLDYIIECGEGV